MGAYGPYRNDRDDSPVLCSKHTKGKHGSFQLFISKRRFVSDSGPQNIYTTR